MKVTTCKSTRSCWSAVDAPKIFPEPSEQPIIPSASCARPPQRTHLCARREKTTNRYKIVRGALDLGGVAGRAVSRSKYGSTYPVALPPLARIALLTSERQPVSNSESAEEVEILAPLSFAIFIIPPCHVISCRRAEPGRIDLRRVPESLGKEPTSLGNQLSRGERADPATIWPEATSLERPLVILSVTRVCSLGYEQSKERQEGEVSSNATHEATINKHGDGKREWERRELTTTKEGVYTEQNKIIKRGEKDLGDDRRETLTRSERARRSETTEE